MLSGQQRLEALRIVERADQREAQRQAEEGRRLAALIVDVEDRTIIESDLASLP